MAGAGRWRSACVFATSILAVAFRAEVGAAEERPEPIRFEYVADPACPSREEILGRIASYTTRSTLVSEEGTRRFDVRIVRRDRGFSGRLELTPKRREGTRQGETIARTIEAINCEDVVIGLAIATALAIDPRASLLPHTERVVEPYDEPVEVAPTPEEPRRPSAIEARDPHDQRRPPPVPAPPSSSSVRLALEARLEANAAVSGLVADVGLFVEIATSPPIARLPWLAPALRVGGKHSATRRIEVGNTDVAIVWKAAVLEACPVRVPLAERLLLDACATGSVGLLSVDAPTAPRPTFHRRLWIDYGGLFAARWLAGPDLFFEAVGGLAFPILRDRFRVEPGGLATLAPPVGWSLAVGGGWRF